MNDEVKPPTLHDWIATNPGSSINDYYKRFPVKSEAKVIFESNTTPSAAATPSTNRSLIITIIICITGFAGYFSPCFKDLLADKTYTGHELIQHIDYEMHHTPEFQDSADMVYFFYLLPISYLIVVIGVALRSYLLSTLGTLVNIIVLGFLLYFLLKVSMQRFGVYYEVGSYLVSGSSVALLLNMISINFFQSEK